MPDTICAEHRSWNMSRIKIRDKRYLRSLGQLGWRVEIGWECDLKKNASLVVKQLTEILRDKN
jgi:G:T-mismatch repair DNA endonuclease (very short patch repair protein)